MIRRNEIGFALAGALVASAAAETAWAGSHPSGPTPPKLPAEEPRIESVRPENPPEPHAPGASGEVAGSEPASVSFEAAAAATAAAGPPQGLQYHIQGSLDQHGPLPDEAPGPGAVPAPLDSSPPVDEPTVPSLAPGDSIDQFPGLADTGWIPPDTILAAGPTSVVEAVNSGFAVYSKNGGTLQGYTAFTFFFGPLLPTGWQGVLFDPRVLYSPEHSSFVVLVLGRDPVSQESYFFVAVSQTSDPTGQWWIYRFSAQNPTSVDSDAWADYCGLGADGWGVYVTCNMFRWTGFFKHGKLWSLTPQMFSGGTANGWVFWDLRWNSGAQAFSLQPATPYSGAADEATFFVNTFSASGSAALLWKLTGDRTDSPSLVRSTVSTQVYNAIGENVDQPDSFSDLDGGDARVMNAAYKERKVYAVLTHDVLNDGGQSGWLLFKIDVDAAALDWQHLIWTSTGSSAGGFYYVFPAITLDAAGGSTPNLAIFGSWTDTETSRSSATHHASGLFKVLTDQPTSGTGPFVSFSSGLESYVALDGAGRNRWGDYSGAAYDWTTGSVWGGVQVADADDTWRTVLKNIEISDGGGSGCTLDVLEPDDTSSQASPLGSGASQTHSICPAGDEDWATFTLASESAVTIETSGPSGDTRLWLLTPGLSTIEFNDDGGSGLFSRIDRACGVNALPAGTYLVEVDEFGNDDEIPTYDLSFTVDGTCTGSCPADLVLSNATISGSQVYRASDSVTLGPDLQVAGSLVQMVAGQVVVFRDGTSVGGTFSAGTSPDPCAAQPSGTAGATSPSGLR